MELEGMSEYTVLNSWRGCVGVLVSDDLGIGNGRGAYFHCWKENILMQTGWYQKKYANYRFINSSPEEMNHT